MEAEVLRLKEALLARDAEVQRMRSVNEELRSSNAALRDANAAGLADPDKVNTAMVSEIEGLRAQRASVQADIDEVLATLEPLLKEA